MKIHLFRKKIEGLRFKGEYTKAIQLIDEYQKNNTLSEEEKLEISLDKCKILLITGKYTGALLVIEELIRICEEMCFPTFLIKANLLKVDALEKSDRESEALRLLEEIEDNLAKHTVITDLERKKCLSDILYYKGSIHWQLGNLDSSIDFLMKSIDIKKDLDDKESLGIAYNRLGTSLTYQGKLNESLEYLKRTLFINQEMNNKSELAKTYNNIGVVYATKGEYELAIECYESALILNKEINNTYYIPLNTTNIGTDSIPLGNYQKSLIYLKDSLELFQKAHSSDYFISACLISIIELLTIAEFEEEDVNPYLDILEALYMKNPDSKTIENRYYFGKALVLKNSDRLIDKVKAQEIFQKIVEDDVVVLENSVKSLLNLAELLIMEFKSTESDRVLLELEHLTNNLLEISRVQKNYTVQVKTLLLESKLAFLNLDIVKAEGLLNQAKSICEERGLNRLAMTIIEEQESIINKRKKWNEIEGENTSYEDRIKFSEINTILTRMVKNKLEVIEGYDNIIDSFTYDKLSLIVFKYSELGAEVVAGSNFPDGPEFDNYSTMMAINFMTIIGQGSEYHEGLFGPLPVPIKGYSSLIFSRVISDRKQIDPRLEGRNFALFCILYPQQYSLLFYDRKSITKLFDTKLKEIDDLEGLSNSFLNDLRNNIFTKVSELIAPKDLEMSLGH